MQTIATGATGTDGTGTSGAREMIASSATTGSRAAAEGGEAEPEGPEVFRAARRAAVVQAGVVPPALRRGRGAPLGRATVAVANRLCRSRRLRRGRRRQDGRAVFGRAAIRAALLPRARVVLCLAGALPRPTVEGWGAPPCLSVGAAAGRGIRSCGSRRTRRAGSLPRPAGARPRAPPGGHTRWVVVGRAAFRAALLPSACDAQDLVGALPRRSADGRDVLPGSSSGAVAGRGGRGRWTRRFRRAGALFRLVEVCRSAPPGIAITCGRWTSAMLLLRKRVGRGGRFQRDCPSSNMCTKRSASRTRSNGKVMFLRL